MQYINNKIVVRFDDDLEVSKDWLSADSDRAQRVLKKRHRLGATCTCTPSGVAMHIVLRKGTYYLASMPGLSSHHALSCPSHIVDPFTNGLRHYEPEAVVLANGIHHLAVAGKLSDTDRSNMSPTAVIHYIWQLSGLNVCTPKTVAARNHYLASNSFLQASSPIRINRAPTKLHVPLSNSDPASATHVSGLVKSVDVGPYDIRISLVGERKRSYWISERDWDRTCKMTFGSFDRPKAPSQPTWLLGAITRTKGGYEQLSCVGAAQLTTDFLICPSGSLPLIEKLIEQERRFFVGLRFDAPDTTIVPTAVLIDQQPPRSLFDIHHLGEA